MARNSGVGQQAGAINNGQQGNNRNSMLLRLNEERFAYVMSCLVGNEITVKMNNGNSMKGKFHSFDAFARGNKSIDIALKNARFVSSKDDEGHSGRPYLVHGGEYSYIVAHDVKLVTGCKEAKNPPMEENAFIPAGNKKDADKKQIPNFKTDAEIVASKPVRQESKLTEWQPDGPVEANELYELDEVSRPTGWDQFESNRKMFGVNSTYDEKLYTTELKLDEVPIQIKEEAEKLAAEIMGQNGDHSYAQLESHLEQDEDNMHNPVAESLVKKAIAKNGKDSKKFEKHLPPPKAKTRSSLPDAAVAPNTQRPSANTRGMSYKDIIANSGHTPSQAMKAPFAGSKKGENPGDAPKPQNQKRGDNFKRDMRAERSAPVTPGSGVVQEEPKAVDSREVQQRHAKVEEVRKGEILPQEDTPRKNVEGPATKSSQAEANTNSASEASQTGKKKGFTFNPNASTFTPYAAMAASSAISPTGGSNSVPPSSGSASNKLFSGVASPTNQDASVSSVMTAFENLEFRAFSTMNEFPPLEVSAYTNGNWLVRDQQCNEMWPNCSEASYRSIIGDIAIFHPAHAMMGIRAPHPIMATPGMTTFFVPPGAPIAYPAYPMAGMPINVMPYTRPMTPRYYGAHKFKAPAPPSGNASHYPGSGSHLQTHTPASGHAQPTPRVQGIKEHQGEAKN